MNDNHVKFTFTGPPDALHQLLAVEARGNAQLFELLKQEWSAAAQAAALQGGDVTALYNYDTIRAVLARSPHALPGRPQPYALPAAPGSSYETYATRPTSLHDLVRDTLDVSPIYYDQTPPVPPHLAQAKYAAPATHSSIATTVEPASVIPGPTQLAVGQQRRKKGTLIPLLGIGFGIGVVLLGMTGIPAKFAALFISDAPIPVPTPASSNNPDQTNSNDSNQPVTTPMDSMRNLIDRPIAPQ